MSWFIDFSSAKRSPNRGAASPLGKLPELGMDLQVFVNARNILRLCDPARPAVLFGGTTLQKYTAGMKTAVSLPDELFQAAERQARRSRKTRSRLYADAIAEYLDRHAPDEVTVAMDRVVGRLDETAPDEFASRAARRTLERSEW